MDQHLRLKVDFNEVAISFNLKETVSIPPK